MVLRRRAGLEGSTRYEVTILMPFSLMRDVWVGGTVISPLFDSGAEVEGEASMMAGDSSSDESASSPHLVLDGIGAMLVCCVVVCVLCGCRFFLFVVPRQNTYIATYYHT